MVNREDNLAAETCILATSRTWNEDMVQSLQLRSRYNFALITDPADLTRAKLDAINPRFVFFPHWSYRIDSNVFDNYECIIFHMTDLPFGRGGSPLQNLIARGIYETRISAVRCVEDIDAGPVYQKKPLSLHGAAAEIYLRASRVIEDMIVEILDDTSEPIPQQGEPTFFERRKPDQGNLNTVESLQQVFDLIRMLDADGYPRAFLELGPFKMEFSRASLKPGEVVADVRITIANNPDGKTIEND